MNVGTVYIARRAFTVRKNVLYLVVVIFLANLSIFLGLPTVR